MNIKSIMHVAFYTKHFDKMIEFYRDVLGGKVKTIVRYSTYLNSNNEEAKKKAIEKPNDIFYSYIEVAEGQFIELFPSLESQKQNPKWNEYCGYTHLSLLTDDIHEAYAELVSKGVVPDTEIKKGPSETFQFWVHDPDGNKIEFMEYTDRSFQVVGHIDDLI